MILECTAKAIDMSQSSQDHLNSVKVQDLHLPFPARPQVLRMDMAFFVCVVSVHKQWHRSSDIT